MTFILQIERIIVSECCKQNGEVRERARFNQPTALAYDEATKTFYVGDWGNHKIRKIAREQASDDLSIEASDDNQNQGNQ